MRSIVCNHLSDYSGFSSRFANAILHLIERLRVVQQPCVPTKLHMCSSALGLHRSEPNVFGLLYIVLRIETYPSTARKRKKKKLSTHPRRLNILADLTDENIQVLADVEILASRRPICLMDGYKGSSYPPDDAFYRTFERKLLGACATATAWDASYISLLERLRLRLRLRIRSL